MAELDFPTSPVDGQTYIANGRVFEYNSSKQRWESVTTTGAQGIQGTQGTGGLGSQGIQGISGTNAGQGIQGIQGTQGTQGTGSVGSQGIQGISGTNAGQGIQGITGSQGIQGIQGISGTSGSNTVPSAGADKTASYTLQTADVGEFVSVGTGGSITIPTGVFAKGDVISIFNDTDNDVTMTCNPTTYLSGFTTNQSSLDILKRGLVTILFVDTDVCVVSGAAI